MIINGSCLCPVCGATAGRKERYRLGRLKAIDCFCPDCGWSYVSQGLEVWEQVGFVTLDRSHEVDDLDVDHQDAMKGWHAERQAAIQEVQDLITDPEVCKFRLTTHELELCTPEERRHHAAQLIGYIEARPHRFPLNHDCLVGLEVV